MPMTSHDIIGAIGGGVCHRGVCHGEFKVDNFHMIIFANPSQTCMKLSENTL